MIPSLLQELEEGKFTHKTGTDGLVTFDLYRTRSNWFIEVHNGLFKYVFVNGKKVSGHFGRKIRKTIKRWSNG